MKTVNVATLKQKLSEYLHGVEKGEEVLVTSHQRPIARLVPEGSPGLNVRPARRSIHSLRHVVGIRLAAPFSAEHALLEDRSRR